MPAEGKGDPLQRNKLAFQRSEVGFRQVVESAPNAIVMIGPTGLIEMVNAQYSAIRVMSCLANQSRCSCLSVIAPTIRSCGSRSLQIPCPGPWEQDATSTV